MQRALMVSLGIVGLAAAGCTQTAQEEPHDTYFTSDTTISSSGVNYATIGYASDMDAANSTHPSSPTIRIKSGGIVEHDIFVYNHSNVIVSGGHIQGLLAMRNRSRATISAGSLIDGGEGGGSLDLAMSSTVDVEGGQFSDTFQAADVSTLTLRGGSMTPAFGPPKITLVGNATLNLVGTGLTRTRTKLTDQSGGTVYKLSGKLSDGTSIQGYELVIVQGGHPVVNMLAPGTVPPARHVADPDAAVFFPAASVIRSAVLVNAVVGFATADDRDRSVHPTSPSVHLTRGGSVGRSLTVYNDSHVSITGGHVAQSVTVRGDSTLAFSDGKIGYALTALDHSHVSMTGGTVSEILSAGTGSTLQISGGQLGNIVYADGGKLQISGGKLTNLQANRGTLELFGTKLRKTPAVDPNDTLGFRRYRLSGTLQDGTSLRGVFLMVSNDGKPQVTFHEVSAHHP